MLYLRNFILTSIKFVWLLTFQELLVVALVRNCVASLVFCLPFKFSYSYTFKLVIENSQLFDASHPSHITVTQEYLER